MSAKNNLFSSLVFPLRGKNSIFYVLIPLTILCIASLSIDPNKIYFPFRLMRVLVSVFCLIYLVIIRYSNKRILAFIIMYSLSSLFIIWYEDLMFARIAIVLNAIAFIFLVVDLVLKIDFKFVGKLFYFFLSIGALLYGYLLLEFLSMLSEFIDDTLLITLISIATFLNFVAGVLTLCRNHEQNTGKSLIFTFFLFFLAFAEVFRGIGYYGFVDEKLGQYMARTLLIISFVFLTRYASDIKDDDIPLSKIKSSGNI